MKKQRQEQRQEQGQYFPSSQDSEVELHAATMIAQDTVKGLILFYQNRLKTNDLIVIQKAKKTIRTNLRSNNEAYFSKYGIEVPLPYDLGVFIQMYKLN